MNEPDADGKTQAQVAILLAAAERKKGANERHLTDAIAALLGADRVAAGQVASLLVDQLPKAVRMRLVPPPASVHCETERRFKRASSFGPVDRRTDLVFTGGDAWGLIVEVKLDAPLSGAQVDDLLALEPRDLGLNVHACVGVMALTKHAVAVAPPDDPGARWLGIVRWKTVIDDLSGITFANSALGESWKQLLSLYIRRQKFGATALQVPHPHTVLQLVAQSLSLHVAGKVGQPVDFVPSAAGRVVRRTGRGASLELAFLDGRLQHTLKITLRVPRGGSRTLRVELLPEGFCREVPRMSASIERFELVLLGHVDALLQQAGAGLKST